jgi:hypothetical protein
MGFSFETQGANTFLVYQLGENDVIDSLSLGMLANNKIAGVAPVLFTQQDDSRYLKYNVSARVPIGKFFSGTVTKKRMLGVLASVTGAIIEADEYMLAVDRFVLDRDFIFTDVTTCEAQMIYLPLMGGESRAPDMAVFFKDIVFGVQYDQSENSDYVAKLISFLNGAELFSLGDFAALIRKLSEGSETLPVGLNSNAEKPPPRDVPPPRIRQPQYTQPSDQELRPPSSPPIPQARPARQVPPVPQATPIPQAPPVLPRRATVDTGAGVSRGVPAITPGQEKKISLFYLLMHYSKENKEAYKAQKNTGANHGAARPMKKTVSENRAEFAVPGAVAPINPIAERRQIPGERDVSVEPRSAAPERVSQASVQAYQPAPRSESAQGRVGNFGETVVLSGGADGHTLNLSDGGGAAAVAPYLIRKRNNEKINLSKPVFHIGKERSFADYFIGDNTAISRSHAEFISRGDEYFVADMNSTNHTYVNGEMIKGGVEVSLEHGDKVRLADEEFEFRTY